MLQFYHVTLLQVTPQLCTHAKMLHVQVCYNYNKSSKIVKDKTKVLLYV